MVYKFLRNILKGVSLTSALFIFEACYGTPHEIWIDERLVRVGVFSADDMSPLGGIAVKTRVRADEQYEWNLQGFTNVDGTAEFYVPDLADYQPQFRFECADGTYMTKDTVISISDVPIEIKLQKNK